MDDIERAQTINCINNLKLEIKLLKKHGQFKDLSKKLGYDIGNYYSNKWDYEELKDKFLTTTKNRLNEIISELKIMNP